MAPTIEFAKQHINDWPKIEPVIKAAEDALVLSQKEHSELIPKLETSVLHDTVTGNLSNIDIDSVDCDELER